MTHTPRQTIIRATTLLASVLGAAMLLALTGCNTTAGLGQDVSAAGQAVTKAADKAKQGL